MKMVAIPVMVLNRLLIEGVNNEDLFKLLKMNKIKKMSYEKKNYV